MELLQSDLSNDQVLTVRFKKWLPTLSPKQTQDIMRGIDNSVQMFLQLKIDDKILIEGQKLNKLTSNSRLLQQ